MKRFKFGWFPRAKYRDLVFYVEAEQGMNIQLFERPDTAENREIMDDLAAKERLAEPGEDARELAKEIEEEAFDPWRFDKAEKRYMGAFDVDEAAALIESFAADRERKAREELDRLRSALGEIIDIGNDDRAYMIACRALKEAGNGNA